MKKSLKKIKKLSNKIKDDKYKGYILSVAKKITNSDKITVDIEELLKLVDPKRVEYDPEDAIDDVIVNSKNF